MRLLILTTALLACTTVADEVKRMKYVASPGCQRWQAHSGCKAEGPRNSKKDKACDETVYGHEAGACLCDDGRRAGATNCGHGSFTCAQKCAELRETIEGTCKRFVPTKNCSPTNQEDYRAPAYDCVHAIPSNVSGYCECMDGHIGGRVSCGHSADFSCAELCTDELQHKIPEDTCASNLGHPPIKDNYIPLVEPGRAAEEEAARVKQRTEAAAAAAAEAAEAERARAAEAAAAKAKAQAAANIRATARANEARAAAAANDEPAPPPPPPPPPPPAAEE